MLPLPQGEGWGEGERITTNQDKTFQNLDSPLHLAANNLLAEYNYKFPVQAVHASQY